MIWHYYNPRLPDLHGDYIRRAGIKTFFEKLRLLAGSAFKTNMVPSLLSDLPFWHMVRKAHTRIHQHLKKEKPFQQLILEIVHPGLVNSLYFQKLGD
ncbi:hypothetical protein [Leptothoe spongobia]|uniref:Uncharacterized protein n=1 Tax=Leptothoe spongobia TAU-MAC 1115 TaxID=1967444 RepID=A0A947GI45_9CYAN|nr:hypothetical protein [Leptothoe spongobia]MBT9315895.1 hypothetical protein [Leptothoe spongobia TAU-MAC 1115]